MPKSVTTRVSIKSLGRISICEPQRVAFLLRQCYLLLYDWKKITYIGGKSRFILLVKPSQSGSIAGDDVVVRCR